MGMSTNLDRFRAIIDRGFSRGDLTVADELCAEELSEHEYLAKTDVPGPQILKAQIEDARHDRTKLISEIQELKNQNAGLIEDHTRDVLSIKAKETQLVRARSDAEAAEQTNERLRRELDRLKRALSKAEASRHFRRGKFHI